MPNNAKHDTLFCTAVGLIHGDMHQEERNAVINAFKKQEVPILVATDVAGKVKTS